MPHERITSSVHFARVVRLGVGAPEDYGKQIINYEKKDNIITFDYFIWFLWGL